MVFQLRQQGIDEFPVIGPAADKEFAFRLHGIAVELLPDDESRNQQTQQARKKDIEKSFFTHQGEIFCKDIKKFLLLCPGESYTTSSYRIPQARNRARVCGRSGAI